AGVVWILWGWKAGIADRLAGTTAVLTASALLMAVSAAWIAVLAYVETIKEPDLKAEVRLGGEIWDTNHKPLPLPVRYGDSAYQRIVLPGRGAELSIELRNAGAVSARNPVVVLVFIGMLLPEVDQPGWAPDPGGGERGGIGEGFGRPIHVDAWITLPPLDLSDAVWARTLSDPPRIGIRVLADGWKSEIDVTLDCRLKEAS